MATMSVEIAHKGLVLDCCLSTWPASRGRRENGLQLEPDDEAGFDIEDVIVITNEDNLTPTEIGAVLADTDRIRERVAGELETMARDRDF